VSLNTITTVNVTIAASGLTQEEADGLVLGFEHFNILSRNQLSPIAWSYVLNGTEAAKAVPISVSLAWPGFSYTSSFSGLNAAGAIGLHSSLPKRVLSAQAWVKIDITGSLLNLQPLFCKVG
jgi:hypothetical protein